MGKVNEFLRIKVAQNKLSVHGFADSIGVTEEESQNRPETPKPQPAFSRRISIALKFTPDEEAEFQQLMEEDESSQATVPLPQIKSSRVPQKLDPEVSRMIRSLWIAIYFLGAGLIILALIVFFSLGFFGEKL